MMDYFYFAVVCFLLISLGVFGGFCLAFVGYLLGRAAERHEQANTWPRRPEASQ